MAPTRSAIIAGTGLIGGSVGMALRKAGWHVTGIEPDAERAEAAVAAGAVDVIGEAGPCDLAVAATPPSSLAAVVQQLLDAGAAIVTDVGSVKAPVVAAVSDPRFVGGHPMAGSEQDGLTGADPDLFRDAVWVLTPTGTTDDAALAQVREVVSGLGAQVIALAPERHDALVAVVSHVPHLTAAVLMRIAEERSTEHRALLRLAAGGFRDMTRVAAGHPAIWPEICAENRTAITDVLDELLDELVEMRLIVSGGDRDELLARLEAARDSRRSLSVGAPDLSRLTEVRIAIRDQKGELARITTLAADLDVNIYDLEIAHSAEGPRGVVLAVVESDGAEQFAQGLVEAGYRPSLNPLE
ncbi:MAG: prephenate dehydrogenase/arogenate dehydrogenase family protein [Acidimicrobiaceae bacterium]|nr:prephenate dehydrogenase/arogenate dehydrogenase family protein [Acidimicrobiaceae bacterium]MCY3645089.1 prephenate dehydrogenase/arogenate dehydrogenase family protein [Acidimicrobiaceae bacterium]MDE0667294.1 prephenate dehydrogenase/arogenate dehydrogenase family protein [Acidimicrobiaceae bacterium]MXW89732.1 prephenate dehydrogenase/arogenate dehydrogenase family protein [Acidimicrobiaceae bacterium]MXY12141.1 prephenate dehydrogenase/arogenate dehydrogenase family protein [Acidimicrob